jgi:4-diphosphocytidyl-2-C-methyl-D-erythritol kinase
LSKTEITLPSPVKLNLFLHITGRRSDGYHLLQTVFQLLDYGDSLSFEKNNTGEITRIDHHDFNLPEQDLCLRAAQMLQQRGGCGDRGITIKLKKKVPPGTGLGAGSSNAATVLLALNKIWGLNLPTEELADLGARLGADVPLFIGGRTAWAEGIGDVLTPWDQPERWYCVLLPKVLVSTQKIFSSPSLERNHPTISFDDFRWENTCNSLQSTTVEYYPEVGQALELLSSFGSPRMSGTGASVYLENTSKAGAQSILEQMPSGVQGFISMSCNISPLHKALGKVFES